MGNSSAVTLALEGIGGAFKLADFDDFGLSNLNRLRAGVQDLGVNKAVICARQMLEIDPYLDIEIYTGGLTEDNIGEFFTGGNGPIDLLVEECGTPWVKIAARDQGIPVVMDCNDRGMLDIERFDHEPDRPLLHGRLGDVKSVDMLDLTRTQKVELILAMVDAERISPSSPRPSPSSGPPFQAGPNSPPGSHSAGALTTEAARRILLGEPCPSGRGHRRRRRQRGVQRPGLRRRRPGPVTEVVRMFIKGGISSQDAAHAAHALDLNNDGVITREEYTAVWLGYFTDNDPSKPASRILG